MRGGEKVRGHFFFIVIVCVCVCLAACVEQSPLYGTCANVITLINNAR